MVDFVTMKIGKCKLTIVQKDFASFQTEGHINEDEYLPGFEEFEIPAKLVDQFLAYYKDVDLLAAAGIDIKEIKEHGHYYGYDSDIFIYFLYFIVNNFKEYRMDVNCEDLFWPVHDAFHAKHDFAWGKTFSCTARNEVVRYRQAYKFLQRNKKKLRKNFFQPLVRMFNERHWGCDYGWRRGKLTVDEVVNFRRIDDVAI